MSRDLGYYRQTEAIFNVIRENENLLKLSELSDGAIAEHQTTKTQLLSHGGMNSVKDYKTRADSSVIPNENESAGSPTRFKLQSGALLLN